MNHEINSNLLRQIINIQTEIAEQGIDLSSIMNIVTYRAQIITNSDGSTIELIEGDELVYSSTSGLADSHLGLRFKISNSLSGESIQEKKILISNDTETDSRVNKDACRKIGIQSMIVVPLSYKDMIVGVLKVFSSKSNHFSEESVEILNLISNLIAASLFNAKVNQNNKLIYIAMHDELTGISNRAYFYDKLRKQLTNGLLRNEHFGIIILDMDGLKFINDTYGHRAGDAAIKEVAIRISNTVNEGDVVSRLGGDEFGIIISHSTNPSDLNMFISILDYNISAAFEFEGIPIHLKASIGYALFNEDGISIEKLIEKADKAMYEMKRKNH